MHDTRVQSGILLIWQAVMTVYLLIDAASHRF